MTTETKKSISFFHPATLISTCFGIGRIPFISGTFGTIFAVILIIILAFMPKADVFPKELLLPLLLTATIAIFIIGVWSSSVYIVKTGKNDPKEIVIDEVAGMFFAVALCAVVYTILLTLDEKAFLPLLVLSPQYLLILFILFRIFDITKPWFIGRIDRNLHGGLGVMLDDMVAGLFAAVTFYILFFAAYYMGGFTYYFSKYGE